MRKLQLYLHFFISSIFLFIVFIFSFIFFIFINVVLKSIFANCMSVISGSVYID